MKKNIDGYSRYSIDEHGNVYSRISGKNLKWRYLNSGYPYVDMYPDKKSLKPKRFLVHRLVAILFVDGYKDHFEVNHIDKDRKNPHRLNLEWVSRSKNASHKYKTYQYPQGSNNCRAKLTEELVYKIKFYFKHNIRTCHISRKLGVHPSTLSEIKQERTWGHLKV
jgi:hypothetical protein